MKRRDLVQEAHPPMVACEPQTRPVEINQWQGWAVLRCPRCSARDATWLHQGDVQVFNRRGEDGELTDVVAELGGDLFVGPVPSRWTPNPSGRRQGLIVHFWCEWCGDGLRLNIAQHKGETLLHWSWSTEPSPENDTDDDAGLPI